MKGNGQNIHELTRVEAFLLSEKAGHPSHMHDHFWTQAEAVIRQRVAAVGLAVNPSVALPAKAKPKAVATKVKKTPEAQLPLDDTPVAPRKAAAPKGKAAGTIKKKTAPVAAKAVAKKAAKPK